MLTLLVRAHYYDDHDILATFQHFLGQAVNLESARALVANAIEQEPGFVWHLEQEEIVAYEKADFPGSFHDIPNAFTTVLATWDDTHEQWVLCSAEE